VSHAHQVIEVTGDTANGSTFSQLLSKSLGNKCPKLARAILAFTGGDPSEDIGAGIASLKRAPQDGGLPTLLLVPKSSSCAGGYFASEAFCSFFMMVRSGVYVTTPPLLLLLMRLSCLQYLQRVRPSEVAKAQAFAWGIALLQGKEPEEATRIGLEAAGTAVEEGFRGLNLTSEYYRRDLDSSQGLRGGISEGGREECAQKLKEELEGAHRYGRLTHSVNKSLWRENAGLRDELHQAEGLNLAPLDWGFNIAPQPQVVMAENSVTTVLRTTRGFLLG